MTPMSKDQIIGVLLDAAARAAAATSATHPVDIATAMSFAIEYGSETMDVLRKRGHLEWQK